MWGHEMDIRVQLICAIIPLFILSCGQGDVAPPKPPATLTFTSSNIEHIINEVPQSIVELSIQVEENLDPATVNAANVHLMPGQGENHSRIVTENDGDPLDPSLPIPVIDPVTSIDSPTEAMHAVEGIVRYEEATRSIIFRPLTPLREGATYHLRIHDVQLTDGRKVNIEPKDADGNEKGVIQFNFRVARAYDVLHTRFSNTPESTVNSYVTLNVVNDAVTTRKHYKANGELKFRLDYNYTFNSGRVAKSLYQKPDGEILLYYYDLIENGVVTASIRATDAGADGVWGNDDDLITSWSEPRQQHLSHFVTHHYSLVDRNQTTTWLGKDNPAFKLRSVYLTENAGPVFQHRNIFYKDLGANGVIDADPVTNEIILGDDTVSLWHKADFVNGKRVRSWSFKGSNAPENLGIDGMLFTEDDVASGLTVFEYYPEVANSPTSGLLKKATAYYDSSFQQPMDQWFTDQTKTLINPVINIHSYTIFEYDPVTGIRTSTKRYRPHESGVDILIQDKHYETAASFDGDSLLPAFP